MPLPKRPDQGPMLKAPIPTSRSYDIMDRLVLDSEKIRRYRTLYVSPEQWLAHDIWTSVMDKLYFVSWG